MKQVLTDILNDEEISKATEFEISDFMKIVEINGDMLGVKFICMYGHDKVKYIPASLVPPEYQRLIEPDAEFVVRGNLVTKYVKDLKFVNFEVAAELDPKDGLA